MAKPDRLLAEARRRLENEHTDFVFIATNDGGIKAEAALWHTKLGLQVFTAINIDGLHSALIIIVEALKKRREDENLVKQERQRVEQERQRVENQRKADEKTRLRWRIFFACIILELLIPFCLGWGLTTTFACLVVGVFGIMALIAALE